MGRRPHALTADSQRLRQLVAESLGLAPDSLERHVPLSRYGLDSLGAVELTARIGDTFGREMPQWLDPADATLDGLAGLLLDPAPPVEATLRERLMADAVLPEAIRPDGPWPKLGAASRVTLLTGATGFLGSHLLIELLRRPGARVVCLVRARQAVEGRARLGRVLVQYRLPDVVADGQVEVVTGDLTRPGLGLSPGEWERLAVTVDSIHHAAALVNWVASYEGLRAVNVDGTRSLLRLACHGPAKPVHFVSSLAVCYAVDGPAHVSEDDDVLARAARLPLGYAQSKCVAEALVRQAGERGLPVTIVRPPLVSGAQRPGVSNPDDLVSALLKGCIEMGVAPDLDWKVDCVPADVVSDAAVRLATVATPGSPRVFHLSSPRARSWRECVLWLNLAGYDVRLVPYPAWLARLEAAVEVPGHPLRPLRGFFLARPAAGAGLTTPELYEEGRRSQVDSKLTRATLARLGGSVVAVGPAQLDRYLAAHVARGFLPPASRPPVHRSEAGSVALTPAFFERVLREGGDGRVARVVAAEARARVADHSLLGELGTWGGTETGLWHYRLHLATPAGRSCEDVVVKVKPRDEVVIAVGERLAYLVDPRLGHEYSRFRHWLGLTGSHLRELAVYAQTDPRFRRHAPAALGSLRDDAWGTWVVVLEDLSGARLLAAVDDPCAWRPEDVEAAVRGIAEVHAIWYGREQELLTRPWLGPVPSARMIAEMRPLWMALADHAAPFFKEWVGPELPRRHRALVRGVGVWWQPLESLPRTLIHNDFNPRNLALRGRPGAPMLCAYDWELATLGVPQRDLAELCCFVLGSAPSQADVTHVLEVHRTTLETGLGRPVDPAAWRLGFRLALLDLLVTRFPMYALAHRVHAQRFLPRILRTWQALDELLSGASWHTQSEVAR
jgi:thioester reductase-like protein